MGILIAARFLCRFAVDDGTSTSRCLFVLLHGFARQQLKALWLEG
jgi:hypothetical protein